MKLFCWNQGNLESLVHGKRACQVREGAVEKGLRNQYLVGCLLHIDTVASHSPIDQSNRA